ncbi:MAG: hypothetical protein RIE56_03675 [Amphiplicatus sp.]
MTHPPSPSDRKALLDAALAHFEIYGGDLARWPEQAQRDSRALAGDPQFEAARRDAMALDAALDAAPAPAASDALMARLLDAAPARAAPAGEVSGWLQRLFTTRRFVPAGALAGLSALGFAAGMVTATGGAAAQDEALVYAEAAVASALEEEDAFWAVEQ